MGLSHAGLLLLLFGSAYSYQFRSGTDLIPFLQDPELEWSKMEEILSEEVAPAPRAELYKSHSSSDPAVPEAKTYAEYVYVLSGDYPKDVFKPEKGVRPLPNWAKQMLLGPTVAPPAAAKAAKAATPGKLVELLCHVDRIYVRVKRTVFKNSAAYQYLKLGTCPVNAGTKEHYYLLYLLKADCGFKKESTADFLLISSVLYYKPSGVVLREMPFEVSLQCKYPRHFRSYKVGFYPKLQGGTVYKALQPKSSITLSAHDAAGNELTGDKVYTLGLPMYFEAKSSAHSGSERIYINRCFMTAYQDPSSTPKYTVIDNQGCMVDSKVSVQSKFLSGTSKMVQKFCVGALVFKDMISPSSSIQQLYMHCELSKGPATPTPAAKACTFEPTEKKWKELYGDDSVCSCCDSTCPSAQPKASRNLITSNSWKVDLSGKNGYVDVNPQMKSLNADIFNLEDPDLAEHEDFLNYWDSDY